MYTLSHNRHKILIVILFILQILVVVRNLESGFFSFFWYCDFAPTLLLVALLFSNKQAVKGILNVGFFAQLGYTIVLFAKLIFGATLFGFVFNFPFTASYIVPTLIIHAVTLITFGVVHQEKPNKKSLGYSLLLLIGMYLVAINFAQPTGDVWTNYNFIFHSNTLSFIPYYTQLWIPLTFILVVLPTYFFQYIVYRAWSRWVD